MAVTQNSFIGNGSTTTYSFTFPYLKASDIKASLDAVDTTAFTLPTATTIQFNTAPANGVKIKIFRETATDNLTATFYAGSAIKSEDLNENFTQNLYSTQEISTRYLKKIERGYQSFFSHESEFDFCTVDLTDLDFVKEEAAYQIILLRIKAFLAFGKNPIKPHH